jgi:hypothetical protein
MHKIEKNIIIKQLPHKCIILTCQFFLISIHSYLRLTSNKDKDYVCNVDAC